ncbi:MAG: cation:proton antiporter, partial [Candidatus Limnocylindria bacterium]
MLALFGFSRGFATFDSWWLEWLTADLLFAVGVGLVVGAAAGRLIASLAFRVIDRGWLSNPFDAFVAIGAILAVYGATELIGGYGFLAVFAASLTFRRYEQEHEVNQGLHDVTLVIEKLGELSVLLLLGRVLPIAGVIELGWPVLIVAFGLLLVVRPLAVLVALLPTSLAARQRLFIAWFGIRGIGSIYYLGFAFAALTPVDARPLFSVTA